MSFFRYEYCIAYLDTMQITGRCTVQRVIPGCGGRMRNAAELCQIRDLRNSWPNYAATAVLPRRSPERSASGQRRSCRWSGPVGATTPKRTAPLNFHYLGQIG